MMWLLKWLTHLRHRLYGGVKKLERRRGFHHLLPLLAFLVLAGIYNGHRYRLYQKDPEDRTKNLTFVRAFLGGKYDQGIYRGIGVVGYADGKRVGWYPGASIPGGVLWRVMGRPMEREGGRIPFFLAFYIPSILAGLGFFYCFYRFAYLKWGAETAAWSLVSLVAYPSSFYFLTAFPYNYSLLCMTAYLLLYESKPKGHWIWQSLLAFYCALTYPSALLFAVYPLVRELQRMLEMRKFNLIPLIAIGLPFALGVFAFFFHLYQVRGDFFAYLNHQSGHFERDFSDPLAGALAYFREKPLWNPENLTFVYLLFFFALFSTRKIGLAAWSYVIILLAFSPLTGSFQCVYRHYLLAFPLHYMFGLSEKKPAVKIGFVLICLYVGLRPYFAYFIKGQLT